LSAELSDPSPGIPELDRRDIARLEPPPRDSHAIRSRRLVRDRSQSLWCSRFPMPVESRVRRASSIAQMRVVDRPSRASSVRARVSIDAFARARLDRRAGVSRARARPGRGTAHAIRIHRFTRPIYDV
jgi:hypothetical protein